MGIERWVYEFQPPQGNAITGEIVHDPTLPYPPYSGWITFGIRWLYGRYEPCFYADLWYGIKFFQQAYIHCNTNEQNFGNWILRFKYCSNTQNPECAVLKEWNVNFKNEDRGRLKFANPKLYFLPSGLENESYYSYSMYGDLERSGDLIVKFENCSGPLENQQITFEQSYKGIGAGHIHGNVSENCSSSESQPYCGTISATSFRTDRDGYVNAEFESGCYSGIAEIKAKARYNDKDRESIQKETIYIPDLAPLNASFVINNPDNENCEHGAYNNYLRMDLNDELQKLALLWVVNEGNPNRKYLKITAGSLPLGGRFDDLSCWSDCGASYHSYHRRGMDIDIGKSNLTSSERKALNEILDKLFQYRINLYLHHQNANHWHLRATKIY